MDDVVNIEVKIDDVVEDLLNRIASLTLENAKLSAVIRVLSERGSDDTHQRDPE